MILGPARRVSLSNWTALPTRSLLLVECSTQPHDNVELCGPPLLPCIANHQWLSACFVRRASAAKRCEGYICHRTARWVLIGAGRLCQVEVLPADLKHHVAGRFSTAGLPRNRTLGSARGDFVVPGRPSQTPTVHTGVKIGACRVENTKQRETKSPASPFKTHRPWPNRQATPAADTHHRRRAQARRPPDPWAGCGCGEAQYHVVTVARRNMRSDRGQSTAPRRIFRRPDEHSATEWQVKSSVNKRPACRAPERIRDR